MTEVKIHELPKITWKPTQAKGSRNGLKVERVVLHTWGGRYTTEKAEKVSYGGVIAEFENLKSQASAHFVYPGSAVPNEITQMVPYAEYAWTEANWNPTSVEIECADAIWQGHDKPGLEQLAHITGFLLHHFKLKPVHEIHGGFCRHGDLNEGSYSHPVCPVPAGAPIFTEFAHLVKQNYERGGYRAKWGR